MSEANLPHDTDEETVKLTELETGTQSDTGMMSCILIYIDFSNNFILIYLLPIFLIYSLNNENLKKYQYLCNFLFF